jgi:hypothetical protein
MKKFYKKRFNLILFIISLLILGTLFFNYVKEDATHNYDIISGFRGIIGNKIFVDEDLGPLSNLVFNWTLAIAFLSPFIISLVLLVFHQKIEKQLYIKRVLYLVLLIAFVSLFIIMPNFVVYMKGEMEIFGRTFEQEYNRFQYDLLIFSTIAQYLALAGGLLTMSKLVIDD